MTGYEWDVFISHASEDAESVARPLSNHLAGYGLKVWLDDSELHLGDSLRAKVDAGLTQSRFGIVVLIHAHKTLPSSARVKATPPSFVTRTGDLLYIFGISRLRQETRVPDTFEAQFRNVITNFKRVLDGTGGTLPDLVSQSAAEPALPTSLT
jgi:enamine deaminase RidA (YjgF/YER057c/UK114 family)